jgi:hypothetical protein
LSLAQECGFFSITFNEMNTSTGSSGERAGNGQAGKSGPCPKVHPNPRVGSHVKQLERISNVPRPQMQDCGWRNQVCRPLPRQQKRDKSIKTLQCFT